MAKNGEKKGFFKKFKHKFQIVIYNEITFEEVWRLHVSVFNIFNYVVIFTFILVLLTISSISYTSLKEFIPGYPDGSMRRNILKNSISLDSLESELLIRDKFLLNIKNIISGTETIYDEKKDKEIERYDNIKFTKSKEDSVLREAVEKKGKYNLSPETRTNFVLNTLHFFPPVNGIVTNSYDVSKRHFGVDIVAEPNSVVSSTLSGTVIVSSWTLETGYVLQIQHSNNLISAYKHNSQLFKKQGDLVKAGEAIAIIGNTGEYTTGPHLHFEIWYNGKSLNPEKYIVF
ncbi:MAG: hypothetical protein B6I24_02400 [Bacteroidetes bacterium 4572_128]|nr:MAG: hypothetical protein B6I24_02400 [Bacteroidetes bacterium 4572_128]